MLQSVQVQWNVYKLGVSTLTWFAGGVSASRPWMLNFCSWVGERLAQFRHELEFFDEGLTESESNREEGDQENVMMMMMMMVMVMSRLIHKTDEAFLMV